MKLFKQNVSPIDGKQNTDIVQSVGKKLLFLCMCIAATFSANAQTDDKKWNIGLHGGIIQYHGDLGHDYYKTNHTNYGFGGLSISRYMGKYLDANLFFARGTLGYHNDAEPHFKSDFSSLAFNLRFNFIGPEYRLRPYVQGGVGAILFDNQLNFHDEKIDYALPTAGAGINFRITPSLVLNIQESFMFTDGDTRDGVEAGKNDDFLYHSAG